MLPTASPAVAITLCGAVGTETVELGTMTADASEAAPDPTAFVAVTVKE